ncbi:Mrp/NBP35 family ATP-binding protein [Clostridium polynesiense]|uniref:Mrp/NBP35 family ATP-binding protein n=1 Tax=Clostridium polynesiense TaxID=1325933 RepID=UPI00058B1EF2|nr:Mrp/NBP35 family ATP-binding protein [Clostridium polynesiense]
MGNCSTCPSSSKCSIQNKDKCGKMLPKYGTIKNIIGVISGKGGVGKSTVTGIIASKLSKAGYKVGVLDADITGPSMPRFFGINYERADMIPLDEKGTQFKFEPVVSELGIKVISMNLLTQVEDQPVIWRGPVINGVLNQMYTDTVWGEIDYLLVDMPPGTGDTALTVMQNFPINSVVIVSTPQDMVSMIVKKVVTMAEKLSIPIKGVVENMSYIQCGSCGEKMRVFSKKSAAEHAAYLDIPLLAELPINLDLAEALEEGRTESYAALNPDYDTLASSILR